MSSRRVPFLYIHCRFCHEFSCLLHHSFPVRSLVHFLVRFLFPCVPSVYQCVSMLIFVRSVYHALIRTFQYIPPKPSRGFPRSRCRVSHVFCRLLSRAFPRPCSCEFPVHSPCVCLCFHYILRSFIGSWWVPLHSVRIRCGIPRAFFRPLHRVFAKSSLVCCLMRSPMPLPTHFLAVRSLMDSLYTLSSLCISTRVSRWLKTFVFGSLSHTVSYVTYTIGGYK